MCSTTCTSWITIIISKMVDGLLAENTSGPLLLLDEILKKGFDGQNFITGLGEHLRNLLVSQDVVLALLI